MARPRLSEDTRLRLLEHGTAAFLQQGYHGTGLKQVLDEVGVPKGSFYNYFDSKEDFGAAAITYYADCLADKMRVALQAAPDALTGVRRYFKAEMRSFRQAEYVGGCLVSNLGGELEGSEICRAALADALHRYHGGIAGALAQAQTDGTVRKDIVAADLAAILIDAWEGAVIRMKIEQSTAPLRHCLDRLLDGFFRPDA